jgi:hypothetical protein
MEKWDSLADPKTVKRTMAALKKNGIESFFLDPYPGQ